MVENSEPRLHALPPVLLLIHAKKAWTRDTYRDNSTEIRIKAIAVWDTVGSLGIPPAPVFGVRGSAKQWKFTNTHVSSKVENAFQALSLDEPRVAFRPALWERLDCNKVTNLKQVWFPGNHGDVGGGWYDQQMANISFACRHLRCRDDHQAEPADTFLQGSAIN